MGEWWADASLLAKFCGAGDRVEDPFSTSSLGRSGGKVLGTLCSADPGRDGMETIELVLSKGVTLGSTTRKEGSGSCSELEMFDAVGAVAPKLGAPPVTSSQSEVSSSSGCRRGSGTCGASTANWVAVGVNWVASAF